MPRHLEMRRRRWYAILDVPADVQEVIGKSRFVKSTQSDSLATAQPRADRLVAMWKTKITEARAKLGRINAATASDPDLAEALFWREALASPDLTEEGRHDLLWRVGELADAMIERTAPKGTIGREGETPWSELPGQEAAGRFQGIATGRVVLTAEHIDPWLATLTHDQGKTLAGRKRHAVALAEEFATLDLITKKAVKRWCVRLMTEEGRAPSTLTRMLTDLRVFWQYLQDTELAPDDLQPFDNLKLGATSGAKARKRTATGTERQPFEAADVVKLLGAAEAKGDKTLADLIRLGMYTGCRIEELCALKVQDVEVQGQGTATIKITEAKTAAGVRDVPVHSQLLPTVERLVADSKDGYLLQGLNADRYGDRSNAVSWRFGKLKTAAGFDGRYVFHSLRKTAITLMERAGVSEGVAADVVGHRKRTITYGLYAGGNVDEAKRAAIEKIIYPDAP